LWFDLKDDFKILDSPALQTYGLLWFDLKDDFKILIQLEG